MLLPSPPPLPPPLSPPPPPLLLPEVLLRGAEGTPSPLPPTGTPPWALRRTRSSIAEARPETASASSSEDDTDNNDGGPGCCKAPAEVTPPPPPCVTVKVVEEVEVVVAAATRPVAHALMASTLPLRSASWGSTASYRLRYALSVCSCRRTGGWGGAWHASVTVGGRHGVLGQYGLRVCSCDRARAGGGMLHVWQREEDQGGPQAEREFPHPPHTSHTRV